MKRLILLGVLTILALSFQIFINCAQPLESDDLINPDPPIVIHDTVFTVDTLIETDTIFVNDTTFTIDTLYLIDTVAITDSLYIYDTTMIIDTVNTVDTIINYDTIIVNDTVFTVDTVNITDTLIVYDTVIVEVPDTSGAQILCARLGSHRQEIVWMLQNSEKEFSLEFTSNSTESKPSRLLFVDIDGEVHEWTPYLNNEFSLTGLLNENTVITIITDKPRSLGHDIDICLKITPIE